MAKTIPLLEGLELTSAYRRSDLLMSQMGQDRTRTAARSMSALDRPLPFRRFVDHRLHDARMLHVPLRRHAGSRGGDDLDSLVQHDAHRLADVGYAEPAFRSSSGG